MLRVVDDLVRRSLFLNFTGVKNHDMVGDLRHNSQVMSHVKCRRAFILDHLLEGLQHFDLGGHIQRGCRLVQHQKIRARNQRHRRHKPLKLATGHLMRIALAQPVRIRQFKGVVQFDSTLVRLFLGQGWGQAPASDRYRRTGRHWCARPCR